METDARDPVLRHFWRLVEGNRPFRLAPSGVAEGWSDAEDDDGTVSEMDRDSTQLGDFLDDDVDDDDEQDVAVFKSVVRSKGPTYVPSAGRPPVPRFMQRGTKKDPPKILLETPSVLVIFKPPLWHCSSFNSEDIKSSAQTLLNSKKPESLQAYTTKVWAEKLRETLDYESLQHGLCHRLDRDTSGPLLIARTIRAWHYLRQLQKMRLMKKEYICLVHGRPSRQWGIINAPLAKGDFGGSGEAFMSQVDGDRGQEALTFYMVLGHLKSPAGSFSLQGPSPLSLCYVRIITGRTHQIRAHFKHIHCPLVCDFLYSKKTHVHDNVWCRRLFLHCQSVSFRDPDSGKYQSVAVRLPADLIEALQACTEDLPHPHPAMPSLNSPRDLMRAPFFSDRLPEEALSLLEAATRKDHQSFFISPGDPPPVSKAFEKTFQDFKLRMGGLTPDVERLLKTIDAEDAKKVMATFKFPGTPHIGRNMFVLGWPDGGPEDFCSMQVLHNSGELWDHIMKKYVKGKYANVTLGGGGFYGDGEVISTAAPTQ